MYTRAYYDSESNKMYMWYIDEDGNHRKVAETPSIEYYVEDRTKKSTYVDMYGTHFNKTTASNRFQMMDFIKTSNVKTCESSLSEDTKFLHKMYGSQTPIVDKSKVQIATIDIEVLAPKFPDAETAEYPITLISIHFSKEDKIYTFGNREYTGDQSINYHYCKDEKLMIEKFIRFFRKMKVDILTGWNSGMYDVPYIINRANILKIEESLSPIGKYKTKKPGVHNTSTYTICGISIMDGLALYKKNEMRKRVSYSLDNIAKEEGVDAGKKSVKFKMDMNEQEWNEFVEYNIHDVVLTKKINDKKKYIELLMMYSYEALIPFEDAFSPIAVITGCIVKELHKNNILYSDIPQSKKMAFPGAYVMAKPGYYKRLVSLDAESLYPSIMRMSNISPETKRLTDVNTSDLIKTPLSNPYECDTPSGDFRHNGNLHYTKDVKGTVPSIIEKFFNERKYWKNVMKVSEGLDSNLFTNQIVKNYKLDEKFVTETIKLIKDGGLTTSYCDQQQYVRKILINAMYGVLGTPYFGFYDTDNAAAVTVWGREIIQFVGRTINRIVRENWHEDVIKLFPEYNPSNVKSIKSDVVCLQDTDSVYFSIDMMIRNTNINVDTDAEFIEFTDKVVDRFIHPRLNGELKAWLDSYNVDSSLLNFKQEKTIRQMFIFAKKKYATEVIASEGDVFDKPEIKITGVEIVRTSTPRFCVPKLKQTLKNMFSGMNKSDMVKFINSVKKDFISAPIDDIAFPRSINDYSKYCDSIDMRKFVKDDVVPIAPSGSPIHVTGSMFFNYIIEKEGLEYEPISNSTKIKFIYVKPNNLQTHVISYTGNWNENLSKYFEVDKEVQFSKAYLPIIQRFFDVIGWGDVVLDNTDIDDFIEF